MWNRLLPSSPSIGAGILMWSDIEDNIKCIWLTLSIPEGLIANTLTWDKGAQATSTLTNH